MRLKGKTALIAGASRNIGRSIALAFAKEGAELILIAREHGDELKQVARECEQLGAKALPVQGDLAKYEEVERMAKAGTDHFGKVDIIVSVAAIRPHKPFWEILASAALFLASDESSYVTGDRMICAGGRYM